ncbi:MAG: MFS transporter [Eubacteriales bacterium]|nr:MFS transporter [Eubacteriales bacterium]
MGLNGAMIGDCIDYGEYKTGIRVQSVLFSSNSVGIKIGQGILTSLLGFFLTAINYDGLKQVQSAATISGIDSFFKYVPIVVCIVLIIFSYLFDLEKKLPGIQKELTERRGSIENI